MNINMKADSLRPGGLLSRNNGLKSTQERMERQQERDRKVAFFEGQKENLKNLKCDSVEEIQRKLAMLHSYEDQIMAAKAAYNSEQMWHIMDESQERGEKIAEAAEKTAPKTPEEQQEEMVKEALGIEDSGGMVEEIMDEATELAEELTEEMMGEPAGEMAEAAAEATGEVADVITKDTAEEMTAEATMAAKAESAEMAAETAIKEQFFRKRFDTYI